MKALWKSFLPVLELLVESVPICLSPCLPLTLLQAEECFSQILPLLRPSPGERVSLSLRHLIFQGHLLNRPAVLPRKHHLMEETELLKIDMPLFAREPVLLLYLENVLLSYLSNPILLPVPDLLGGPLLPPAAPLPLPIP